SLADHPTLFQRRSLQRHRSLGPSFVDSFAPERARWITGPLRFRPEDVMLASNPRIETARRSRSQSRAVLPACLGEREKFAQLEKTFVNTNIRPILLIVLVCFAQFIASAGRAATLDESLVAAAAKGRTSEAQDLLARGADPNAKDAEGTRALIL